MKHLSLSLLSLLAGMAAAQAVDVVYVSALAPDGGDGSTNLPYNNITKAISNSDAKTVMILPGQYREAVKIQRSVSIVAACGPNYTQIVSPGVGVEVSGVAVTATIQGLMITALSHGVQMNDGWYGTVNIFCSVIQNSGGTGALVGSHSDWRNLNIENSIILNVKGNGIYCKGSLQKIRIRNSSITKCAGYLFNGDGTSSGSWDPSHWSIAIEYSNASNFGRNFSGNILGTTVAYGDGMISTLDPKWLGGDNLDQGKLDFRLSSASPFRDAGNPSLTYFDPDNTRNDIGAYGGPYSRGFFENPVQGPMVLGVTVDNTYVPRGAKITVRARGSIYK
jgi:hypothetical protein